MTMHKITDLIDLANKAKSKIKRLTKEQAIILSGYTGVTCCRFSLLHEDLEKRLGYPVFSHLLANPMIRDKIEKLYREDFLALAYEEDGLKKGETDEKPKL